MIQFGKLQFSTYNLIPIEKAAVPACRCFCMQMQNPTNVCICSPNLIHWQHQCKLLNCAMGLCLCECVCVRVHIKHYIVCTIFALNTDSSVCCWMWIALIWRENTHWLLALLIHSHWILENYQIASFQRIRSNYQRLFQINITQTSSRDSVMQ